MVIRKDRFIAVITIAEIVEAVDVADARRRVLNIDGKISDMKEVSITLVPLPQSEYKTFGEPRIIPA